MGAISTLNPVDFANRYREFDTIAPSLLQAFYAEAALYHRNDGGGPVVDAGQQSVLMNMVTAHIVALNIGVSGQPASQVVGRVSSASEGSVSVSTDYQAQPGTAQWWSQTKYGAAYWAATASYRGFRYFRPAMSQGFV